MFGARQLLIAPDITRYDAVHGFGTQDAIAPKLDSLVVGGSIRVDEGGFVPGRDRDHTIIAPPGL